MNAIEIRHAVKRYEGFALNDVSLDLPEGCVLGLVGENGAGKSTLISMLLGITSIDGGTFSLLGVDSQSAEYDRIKQDVGVVLDEACLPDGLNAAQLARVMALSYQNWSDATYSGYLRRFNLPERKLVKDYSRGMKMKLALSVALSHGARLLVLDEATSGLDPMVRDEVLDILSEYTRDERNAVLMSSHIVTDLEKTCDYIAFFHKGRLLFCEEKDALVERHAMLRCTGRDFEAIDRSAVKAVRRSEYGVEALVLRDKVPSQLALDRASLEEIIVLLAKGGDE